MKQHQGTHCVSLAEFELNRPVSARDPGWSPWLLYDPDDPGSYTKTFERASLGQMFFFAVQARDAAGAITADMIWNENVRHMRVSGDKIPVLNFSDSQLGDFRFVGTRGLRSVEIIGGFPITASWSGDASAYAGTIEAYRWGWDVLDPESTFDPGWAVQWGDTPAHRTVGSKTFDEGIHRLTIACRDNSGSVSRATILINIIPIPDREFRRQLLIVEDIPILEQSAHLGLERRWQADLLRLAGGTLRYFGPEDWIDADAEPERVTFRELIKYQTILWMAGSNGRTFYYEQFGFAGASPVHWLEVYQQRVGNLLFVGSAAASAATRGSFTGGSLPLVYSGRGRSWAYENFCLATSDLVRPPLGVPEGELPTRPLRSLQCDGIVEATLADEFAVRYPESRILLSTLLPTQERLALDRPWWFQLDEFYNHNATFANIAFVARDCQLPFLRLRTRRATGVLEIPEDECVPPNTSRSLVEGAAIAIASTANSQTKPLQGSEDFLLGFNPFSYREEGVRRLFRYIFVNHWGLETF